MSQITLKWRDMTNSVEAQTAVILRLALLVSTNYLRLLDTIPMAIRS